MIQTRSLTATVDDLLIEQVHRTPTARALDFGDTTWTFGQLNDRAEELAARFAAAGASPGDVIGLHLQRGPDMVAAMWAAWKIGCAYLPLDPNFPAARLELVVNDARPRVVLSHSALEGRRPASDAPVLLCDDDAASFARGAIERGRSDPEALAYILYTSGSTGVPKGVEIRHKSVVNLLTSMQRRLGFTAKDVLLAVTTISFDISVLELFLPLISGGRIVLAPSEVAADPQALGALVGRSDCTFMQSTPAGWRYLIETGWPGKPRLTALCGGEAMSRDLADRLLTRADAVWNLYGPTETTVWSTMHRVQPGAAQIPIGEPIDNTTLHILDEAGAPTDGIGELHIGGIGLARGYRNRPDLTAERFLTRDRPADQRLYRTGDLVRRDAAGQIEFLGRTDSQVKIRGFRIELGDVEAALAEHPDVAWAAVQAWPDQTGEKSLAAYVVPRGDKPVNAVELREFVRARLPAYMAPSRVVAMAALPMTPNGKVDRKALPPPEAAAPVQAESGKFETESQAKLAAIWAELLNVADVRASDNFFDLGGYSLLTVMLVLRIEEVFGRSINVGDVFVVKDLAEMAALLDDSTAGGGERPIPLQPEGSRPPLYWFEPGSAVRPLIDHLDRDQPLYGLGLSPAEAREFAVRPPRIHDLAAPLLRRLRAAQPAGPYYLGGYGPWGMAAYEAAAQLQGEGEEVALVVLVDSALSAGPAKGTAFRQWLRDLIATTPPSEDDEETDAEEVQDPFAAVAKAVQRAGAEYRPPRYSGRVALLRTKPAGADAALGWSTVAAGALTVDEVQAAEPEADAAVKLVRTLEQRLAEAQAQTSP